MAIKQRKQVTGTTEQINAYAGVEGQLVWNKTTKRWVGMSGTAGTNYPMASERHQHSIANVADLQKALDSKATKTELTEGLAGKAPSSHTHTSAQITDLSNTLAPYAKTIDVSTGLAGKANKDHTHTVSQITDMPKAVLSVNGQTPNDDGNISPSQTGCLPLTGGTLTGGVGHSILDVSKTSGTVTLTANRIHKMNISGATTFSLPAGNASVFTQIKVMVNVTGTPSINWGTSRFFNKKVPSIAEGQYDFYFDYDPTANAWVAGAVPKGVA